MKASMLQGLVIAAIAAGASANALADDDPRTCSEATLKGTYIFAVSGFTIVGGVAQPKAIVQFTRFDGDGIFTVPAGTVSMNGIITHIPSTVVGVYTLGPDCTGSYQFAPPGGPIFDLFASPGGSEYWLIQTGPGAQVLQGTGERLSR